MAAISDSVSNIYLTNQVEDISWLSMARPMLRGNTRQFAAHYIEAENLTGMSGGQPSGKVRTTIIAKELHAKSVTLESSKLG
jgi:hypothetical protein